jgi:hypothetical protein
VIRDAKNTLSARSFRTADFHIAPVENSPAKFVVSHCRPARPVSQRSSILAFRGQGAAVFVFRNSFVSRTLREVSSHP